MNKLLAKLPPFALPFVTRSLRGGRGKRYALISLLLAGATLLLGFWIAFGTGQFEQELRRDLDLEGDLWERQAQEFAVYSFDHDALLVDRQAAARLQHGGPFPDSWRGQSAVWAIQEFGRQVVEEAAWSDNAVAPEHVELRDRARQLLGQPVTVDGSGHFAWHSPEHVALLQRVLDRQGIPEVRRYDSPLTLRESLAIIGFIAGLGLAAAMTLFAPLLVGMQQAQEQHENTLAPLTGTGLRPRELALGLASGPLSVVALFAVPQLALFLGCALLSGDLVSGLSLLAALVASSLFVTLAAQLLGHLVGPKRTPGIVTLALMGVLGVAWLVGAGLASNLESETTGLAAVLPTMGLSVLLVDTFGGVASAHAGDVLLSTLIWSGAALMFAWLILDVLARKIEGRPGSPLGSGAALLGALTCIALVHVAIPDAASTQPVRLYVGLAGLLAVFGVLLMGRVPTSDIPPRMRRLPVPRLLLELAGWVAIHIVISATMFDMELQGLHPVALVWVAWCVGVLGLMAIRSVTLPSTLASHLFIGFCGAAALMGFSQAVYWAFEPNLSINDVFVMSEISPLGGLIQIAVTIAVPVLLLRILRSKFASLTTADSEPSIPSKSR